MSKKCENIGPALDLKGSQLDVLLILPPLFVFMGHDFPSFPLGLGYLVSYLRERGVSSRIYNADIYIPSQHGETPLHSFVRRIVKGISGFSYFAKRWPSYFDQVHDLDNSIWDNLRLVLRSSQPSIVGINASVITIPSTTVLAQIVRQELPEAKIVVGGPAATTCAEDLIYREEIDFLVLGEGEETFSELSAFLLKRKDRLQTLNEIRGLMYRKEGEVIKTIARSLIPDLDSLPFPDRESMFVVGDDNEFRTYYANSDVLASRGCPYPCRFCCAFVTWGSRKTRFRGVNNIVDELIYLNQSYGQRSFIFWDDLFTANRKRTVALCEKIIESGLDIQWVCLARLNTLDAELLALMKRAGCIELQVGIESGNDRVLRYVGKDLTLSTIREKTAIIRSSGIDWGVFFIIGFPTETLDEMKDSLRLIKEIRPTQVYFSVFSPYPGTEFFEELNSKGLLDDNFMRGDFWNPYNNYTGTMEDKDFARFAVKALKFGDRYNKRHLFKASSLLGMLKRVSSRLQGEPGK